ncbi:uncharacterized protein [Rutidosis leptorrhynchoides]|uniref:uncharacterized protein n=1 Tax=Rutidosis leptorrhynchoides TaxID=125765 RepID=UPI003A98ED70
MGVSSSTWSRQGDPLSSYLFLLIMEGLHLCLKEKVDAGGITGYLTPNPDVKVSHLFYADDAVILSEISELKNKVAKSHLFGLGVHESLVDNYMDLVFSKFTVRVIKTVHGTDGGLQNTRFSNSIWCNIVASFQKTKDSNLLPADVLRRKVGRGDTIRFWKDNWLGDEEDCSIADKLINGSWEWTWIQNDIGARNGAALRDLCSKIGHVVLRDERDSWHWSLAEDNGYSVSGTRCYIDEAILPTDNIYKMWIKEIPRKINNFIWRLALDRLHTRLNLSRCGLEIEAIWCVSCGCNIESIHHVVFECEIPKSYGGN